MQADCILWGTQWDTVGHTVRHCGAQWDTVGALPTDGARWTNSTTKLKCGCLKQTHSYIPPHHQQPIKIQYIFCSVGNTRVTVKGGNNTVCISSTFPHSTRRAWQTFNDWKEVSTAHCSVESWMIYTKFPHVSPFVLLMSLHVTKSPRPSFPELHTASREVTASDQSHPRVLFLNSKLVLLVNNYTQLYAHMCHCPNNTLN